MVAGGLQEFRAAAAAAANAESSWREQEFKDFTGGGHMQPTLRAGAAGVEGFFEKFDTESFESTEIGKSLRSPVTVMQHFGKQGESYGDDTAIDSESFCGLIEKPLMFAGPVCCTRRETIPCLSEACEDRAGVRHIEKVDECGIEAFEHGDFDGIHQAGDGDRKVIADEEQCLEV